MSGKIIIGEAMSEVFEVTCDLRQGCVLSPFLFSLYKDSVVKKLRVAGVRVEGRGQLITALLYADDVVLFAKSEEEMRVSLRVLSEWCRERSVELNVEKCGVMYVRKRGVRRTELEEVFEVDGVRIEVVEEFKYLGCVVMEQMGRKRMVVERAQAGSRALSDWLRKCRNAAGEIRGIRRTFVRLMEMLVGSVLLYGAEVWGGGGQLEPVESKCKCEQRVFSWG